MMRDQQSACHHHMVRSPDLAILTEFLLGEPERVRESRAGPFSCGDITTGQVE